MANARYLVNRDPSDKMIAPFTQDAARRRVFPSSPMDKDESAPTLSGTRAKLPDEALAGGAIGKFRWVICALLFLGISKNYMDRQVLGVLKTTLQHNLGWNEID